ncbi:hypothetical protein RESH_05099 [Rhodopirellula europaea SH398]|uniref:Uncharacterized protein n=1 Tax=Rhodopirellula europaea SH398 TaxID=1263868 RepID=M5SDQ3_9BACT|nr:hypothetical protein RESH_05099 [Rhodopirellula europaea SH398]
MSFQRGQTSGGFATPARDRITERITSAVVTTKLIATHIIASDQPQWITTTGLPGRSKRRQTTSHDDGQSRGLPNAIHDPSPVAVDIAEGRSTMPAQSNNVLVSLLRRIGRYDHTAAIQHQRSTQFAKSHSIANLVSPNAKVS